MEAIEAPSSWFAIGQLTSLVALTWLAHASFGMPLWQSLGLAMRGLALALQARVASADGAAVEANGLTQAALALAGEVNSPVPHS